MTHQNNRWRHRPEGSTWGDWGPDDTLGRMNLLTPQKVREGIEAVRTGKSFSLGLPLTLPGGTKLNANRLPPVHRPNLRSGQPNVNCGLNASIAGATDILNDDLVILHPQYSTQWDALVHAGARFDADGDGVDEICYYNGFTAADIEAPTSPEDCGATAEPGATTVDLGPLGIGSLAEHPVQGRAVMIDIERHFGTDERLFTMNDLQYIIDTDAVEVRSGDIVLFHTGFAEKVLSMGGDPDAQVLHHYGACLDGTDAALLEWISDSGIAAIAADNYAVEKFMESGFSSPAPALPLHHHCLFRLGVQLGELWHLTPLARHLAAAGQTDFLLTAQPLNLPGASGSPLNPVATA